METLSSGVRKCQEVGGRSRVSRYFVLVFSPSLPLGKGEGGDKKGRKKSAWPFQWTGGSRKERNAGWGLGLVSLLRAPLPVSAEWGWPAPALDGPTLSGCRNAELLLDFDPMRKRRETHSNRHGDKLISHACCSSSESPHPLQPAPSPAAIQVGQLSRRNETSETDNILDEEDSPAAVNSIGPPARQVQPGDLIGHLRAPLPLVLSGHQRWAGRGFPPAGPTFCSSERR